MKLKYTVRIKNRHGGEPFYYFEHGDGKRTRLRGAGQELLAHHAELLAARSGSNVIALPTRLESSPRPQSSASVLYLAGSIGWVVERYLASGDFGELSAGSQDNYRRVLGIIKAGPIGASQIADLTRGNVTQYCRLIAQERGKSRAKMVRTLLSKLWHFALGLPEAKIADSANNPMRDVRIGYSVTKPHAAWPQDVQTKFLDGAPAPLALAFMLLKYTGQRRSDVVKMKWSDYDGRSIRVIQKKTGTLVDVRIHKELARVLAEAPRKHANILLDKFGTPYVDTSLTHAFLKRLRAVGIDDGQYTLHGLRKTAGVALAEAGCTETEIMRVLGHTKADQAHAYCADADKLRITDSAMAKWEAAG
jgi:integrase